MARIDARRSVPEVAKDPVTDASLTFAGDFGSLNVAKGAMSSVHASAYFNTFDSTLYVDVNHDKVIDNTHDMAIHFFDRDTFSANMFL